MFETLSHWHSLLIDVNRVPVIIMALLLSAAGGLIFGPVAGRACPLLWIAMSGLFGRLGDRLDRKHRTQPDLMLRGFILSVMALAAAFFAGRFLEKAAALYDPQMFNFFSIIAFSALLASGSVWFMILRLYAAIQSEKAGQGAYYALAHTARRNLAAGDDHGVIRAALGSIPRLFDKAVVAPAIWFLIGGFPLAMLSGALAALSWRFGKDGFNSGFAAIPLALERLMGFVPSMFAAVLLAAAAGVTPTAKLHKGLGALLLAKPQIPYEQGGLPLSVMAWALNVSLGGAAQDITGSGIKGIWAGPEGATAKLGYKHLRRGLYISIVAHLLFIAALLGAYIFGAINA